MATEKLQIYKCLACDNIIEVVHAGIGQLVCCNQPMALQAENTTDAAQEKHVPVVEKVEGGVKIKVGSVPHPMADDHYIEWIEVACGGCVGKKFLAPGDAPEAFFPFESGDLTVRAYCNLHGNWRA